MSAYIIMKTLFLGLGLTNSLLCHGQAFTPAKNKKILEVMERKATYQLLFYRDTIGKKEWEDCMVLEMGENYAKFHSVFIDRIDSVMEYPHLYGIRHVKKGHADGVNPSFWMKENQIGLQISYFWNYPQTGNLQACHNIIGVIYTYNETPPLQAWKIEDSTQYILQYACQKATTEFRGRHWEVWFALEIPISLGPWKLAGLPGLILKAESKNSSDGDYFCFTLTGLTSPQKTEYIYTHTMPQIKASRNDVLKLERKKYEDPIGLFKEHGKQLWVDNPIGGIYEAGTYSFPYRPPFELE